MEGGAEVEKYQRERAEKERLYRFSIIYKLCKCVWLFSEVYITRWRSWMVLRVHTWISLTADHLSCYWLNILYFQQGTSSSQPTGSAANERRSRLFSKDKTGGFSLKQQKQGTSGGGGGTNHHHHHRDRFTTNPTSSAQDISNVSGYNEFRIFYEDMRAMWQNSTSIYLTTASQPRSLGSENVQGFDRLGERAGGSTNSYILFPFLSHTKEDLCS